MGEEGLVISLVTLVEDWRTPIRLYLFTREIHSDKTKAIQQIRQGAGYCLINDVMYRKSTSSPLLKFMSLKESTYVLNELHEEIYGLYVGSRALAAKTTREDFY